MIKGKPIYIIVVAVVMLVALVVGTTLAYFNDAEVSSSNVVRTINNWYNLAWHWRRPITIDHTKVQDVANPATAYASFPVLVYATGLSNINANGTDIRFTSSNGMTELPRQIESYSSGTLYAWVKVTLTKDSSDSSNDVIYMYYGNTAATEPAASSTYGSQNVWNTNYKLVTHLKDVTTSTVADSTVNDNPGNKKSASHPAVTTSGKIYNAQSYTNTSDGINSGTGASINNIFASGGTAEAWIYPTGWGTGNYARVFHKGHNTGWSFYLDNLTAGYTKSMCFIHGTSTGTGYSYWLTPASSIQLSTWQHVVVVFNKSNINNAPTVYINGVSQTLTKLASGTGTFVSDAAQVLYTGSSADTTRTFAGTIDEAHLSNAVRSAGWIKTEFNNQNSPATFCSAGSEE